MSKVVEPGTYISDYKTHSLHREGTSASKGQTIGKPTESFNRILTDTLANPQGKAETPIGALPLLKQELIRLIAITQNQMNAAFFDALNESDEESSLYSDPMDWLDVMTTGYGTDFPASKFQHLSEQVTTAPLTPAEINSIIGEASEAYHIDAGLIQAVIRAESDFDVNSTSSKGAMGLMQLMPETAKDLGVEDAYDPVQNIHGGTRYLKNLLDRYEGNVPLALAAYNWGMGNVERNPDRLPRETRTYISRVNKYFQEIRA